MASFEEGAGEGQVSGERLEDMLPGACGGDIADRRHAAFAQGPRDIHDQPVFTPVTTADDVACAG